MGNSKLSLGLGLVIFPFIATLAGCSDAYTDGGKDRGDAAKLGAFSPAGPIPTFFIPKPDVNARDIAILDDGFAIHSALAGASIELRRTRWGHPDISFGSSGLVRLPLELDRREFHRIFVVLRAVSADRVLVTVNGDPKHDRGPTSAAYAAYLLSSGGHVQAKRIFAEPRYELNETIRVRSLSKGLLAWGKVNHSSVINSLYLFGADFELLETLNLPTKGDATAFEVGWIAKTSSRDRFLFVDASRRSWPEYEVHATADHLEVSTVARGARRIHGSGLIGNDACEVELPDGRRHRLSTDGVVRVLGREEEIIAVHHLDLRPTPADGKFSFMECFARGSRVYLYGSWYPQPGGSAAYGYLSYSR